MSEHAALVDRFLDATANAVMAWDKHLEARDKEMEAWDKQRELVKGLNEVRDELDEREREACVNAMEATALILRGGWEREGEK